MKLKFSKCPYFLKLLTVGRHKLTPMQPDWTIIGIIIGALTLLVTYLQFLRAPKTPDNQDKEDAIAKRSEDYLTQAQKAIENKNLLYFLKWKYSQEPILERDGYIYPVAVYQAPKTQREDLESVLKLPLLRHEPKEDTWLVKNDEYLNIVNSLKQGRGLSLGKDINTYTYAMKSLLLNGKLQLDCDLGHYFSTFRTCEILEWEIRSNIGKLKGAEEKQFKSFDNQLPLRKHLHNKVANPVRDGTGRSPAIGISTLIAYNDAGSIKLMTKRRAKKGVPLRAGLLHVIPGFMFQPTTDHMDYEYSVTHNIYREYLEELFNFPEQIEKRLHPNHFYSDKRLQYLKSLIAKGEAKLYFTGVTINLLNLRPEICTLLYITTPEWYEKCQNDSDLRWEINDEFTNIHEGIAKPEEFIGGLSFSHDDSQMIKDASLYPHRTVPAGAGAFWLGIDTLRDLDRNNDTSTTSS